MVCCNFITAFARTDAIHSTCNFSWFIIKVRRHLRIWWLLLTIMICNSDHFSCEFAFVRCLQIQMVCNNFPSFTLIYNCGNVAFLLLIFLYLFISLHENFCLGWGKGRHSRCLAWTGHRESWEFSRSTGLWLAWLRRLLSPSRFFSGLAAGMLAVVVAIWFEAGQAKKRPLRPVACEKERIHLFRLTPTPAVHINHTGGRRVSGPFHHAVCVGSGSRERQQTSWMMRLRTR